MSDEYNLLVGIVLVVLVISIVIFIVSKIFQVLVFSVITAIIISISFSVIFGNGHDIIHFFTTFMDKDIAQKIEYGYDYYKEKEKESSLLNAEKIVESIGDILPRQ